MHKNGHYKTKNLQETTEPLPPHSQEAEESLLGSLIIDPDALYRVADTLFPEHFYVAKNRQVYEVILSLHAQGITPDVVTLGDKLRDQSDDDWGAFLVDIVTRTPSSCRIVDYSRSIISRATRRRMIKTASKIATMAYDTTDDVQTQIDTAESLIFDIRGESGGEGAAKPRVYTTQFLDRFERLREHDGRSLLGLPTGFIDLDKMTDGLQAPYLYILAARPSMGKSALALNISANLALNHGKRIAFFSLEMSESQLINRILAGELRIDSRQVQKPWTLPENEIPRIYEMAGRISDSKLFIDTTAGIRPAQIRARSMRLFAEHGLDLIVVDHLHLTNPDRELSRKDLEIGETCQSLAELGKTLNVPVLALSQLSRKVENRSDKRPTLGDLRESGKIEEDAFCVMFLYRDDYYNDLSERPNIVEVNIAKNREGATGTIDLYWHPQTVTFRNLAKEPIQL